nr:hypothetical protein [Tanacetum cinerariifolium]
TALSAVPISLSFLKALVDKVPVLLVQHQVPNWSEIPLIESVEMPEKFSGITSGKSQTISASSSRFSFDLSLVSFVLTRGNKMHKAFLLLRESSHWQYKFPLPVKVVPTARRLEMPLSGVCTTIEEMMKKLPVKDRWQLH